MKLNIAVLPGDGIGPEVTAQSIEVLKAIALEFNHQFTFKKAVIGAIAIEQENDPLPKKTLELCRSSDAILLGTLDRSKDAYHPNNQACPEQGLSKLHKELNLYVNTRSVTVYDTLLDTSPLKREVIAGTNISIYSKLNGGIYFDKKHFKDDENYVSDLYEYSHKDIECITHKAFQAAQSRAKKVTLIDTANLLETSRLWRRIATEISSQYPDVDVDFMFVNNAAIQLITNPSQFDVVLIEYIFGGIINDITTVISGSLGLQAAASIGDNHALFQPCHGSLPKEVGKRTANPIASILSAAMLLEHFGLYSEAEMVKTAVHRSLELNITTPDLNSASTNITTSKVGDFITDFIRNPHDSNKNFNNIHLGQSTII
jgi:3-isopropylmalate dehydrogenase